MKVYQFNPDMPPDTSFLPGELKYVVPGNEGRWLDPRRTPVRVVDVKTTTGVFVVELLDFEDRGAHWELPLEQADRCQFAQGSAEATAADVESYRETISRFDRPLEIPADPSCRATSETTISSLREDVGEWMERKCHFFASLAQIDFSARTGNTALWTDFKSYMTEAGLWDIEETFATQFVRNPHSGELVKGHRIVLAELGLVAFEGTQVRDPGLFDGSWSKPRRAEHILHRLAFVRELFQRLGHLSLVLYRGFSTQGPPKTNGDATFVSATFNIEVAMDHFNERDRTSTGILVRQSVPIERLFMSFLETAQMNDRYKEVEAVLLYDSANSVF